MTIPAISAPRTAEKPIAEVWDYVNRVQEAIFREMVHCVAEGIVSVEKCNVLGA